jgi:nucleoid-associated protein YgaU
MKTIERGNIMKVLLISMLIMLVSCSGNKKSEEVKQEDSGVKLSDAKEFVEEEVTATNEDPNYNVEQGLTGNLDNAVVAETSQEAPVTNMAIDTSVSAEKTYDVQKNETLMMISFKIYGDYGKWRQIYELNQAELNNSMTIREGMKLKYLSPSEEFVWNPQGNAYLIKNGDTLGTISNEVYSTTSHWKKIWENNKPLIKDPNKIFTGFTIYTPYTENLAQN